MKIEIFKKEKNFRKKDFHLDPNLYWRLAVPLLAILFLGTAYFGYTLFMKIDERPIVGTGGVGSNLPRVDKERLEKVLGIFEGREEKSKDIINFGAPVVDPSI